MSALIAVSRAAVAGRQRAGSGGEEAQLDQFGQVSNHGVGELTGGQGTRQDAAEVCPL